MLRVRGLVVNYGPIEAVRGIDLEVGAGEIVAVVGANGAGKSTTLKTVVGLLAPIAGEIVLAGERIDGLAAPDVVGRGLTLVPEGRLVFPAMTVLENLELGFLRSRDRSAAVRRARLERILDGFPALRPRLAQLAGTLSGGQQQMLAIGRALMLEPRMLLLDEPSLGLSPRLVEEVAGIVGALRRDGITILLVEQNAVLALELSDRAYVMENGRVALSGPSEALRADERVQRAYLGI
jgi:branched-chain amino acid transport system ATP-binding protein